MADQIVAQKPSPEPRLDPRWLWAARLATVMSAATIFVGVELYISASNTRGTIGFTEVGGVLASLIAMTPNLFVFGYLRKRPLAERALGIGIGAAFAAICMALNFLDPPWSWVMALVGMGYGAILIRTYLLLGKGMRHSAGLLVYGLGGSLIGDACFLAAPAGFVVPLLLSMGLEYLTGH